MALVQNPCWADHASEAKVRWHLHKKVSDLISDLEKSNNEDCVVPSRHISVAFSFFAYASAYIYTIVRFHDINFLVDSCM